MHLLDRGDVEAAGRRRGDEHARVRVELARDHDLLEVAAGEVVRLLVRPGRLDLERADRLDGAFARIGPSRRNGPIELVAERLEPEVLRDRERRRDAGAEPVLGHVADPGLERRPRVAVPHPLALDADRALRARPQPRDRLGELALAVAGDAGDGGDLARPDGQRDALDRGAAAVAVGPDVRRARAPARSRAARAPRGSTMLDVAADHQRRERLRRRVGGLHGGERLPGAEHGDAVRDRLHLVQLVRDEDDRPPLGGHLARVTNRLSASSGVSTAVGSSRIRMRASW